MEKMSETSFLLDCQEPRGAENNHETPPPGSRISDENRHLADFPPFRPPPGPRRAQIVACAEGPPARTPDFYTLPGLGPY